MHLKWPREIVQASCMGVGKRGQSATPSAVGGGLSLGGSKHRFANTPHQSASWGEMVRCPPHPLALLAADLRARMQSFKCPAAVEEEIIRENSSR